MNHDRSMEHERAAANPPSYPNNAIGKHYLEHHTGQSPRLTYQVLDRQPDTVKRKISEAFEIMSLKPTINDKAELKSLRKFLV